MGERGGLKYYFLKMLYKRLYEFLCVEHKFAKFFLKINPHPSILYVIRYYLRVSVI